MIFFLNMCMKTHLPLFNILSEVPQNHNRFSLLLLYLFIILKPFYHFQAANLRSLLLKRYFGNNYSKIAEVSEEKTSQNKEALMRGEARVLKRAGVTLFEMQCQLNKCGATDLVIDIIMKKPSYHVFVECIKLGISLLEGGNYLIQVSSIHVQYVISTNLMPVRKDSNFASVIFLSTRVISRA